MKRFWRSIDAVPVALLLGSVLWLTLVGAYGCRSFLNRTVFRTLNPGYPAELEKEYFDSVKNQNDNCNCEQ